MLVQAFSPNLKYIVSVGSQHDMMVSVWNWRANSKLASNKVATKVSGVAWSEDSSTFVTVGLRHVKFWYLDTSKSKVANFSACNCVRFLCKTDANFILIGLSRRNDNFDVE